MAACDAASGFWARASTDKRISEGFRAIAAANARHLRDLAERV
jgi:hypothetical protein